MDSTCSIGACGPNGCRKKTLRRGEGGVSLLELIAVLAILAVMAAIALPDLSRFASKKVLSCQAEQMADIIHRARDLAMEQGFTWRVSFRPSQGTWVCYCDEDDDLKLDSQERTLGPYMLEKGVCFGCLAARGPNDTSIPDDGVSFADNRISFSPMGCCNSGSIYLSDRDHSIAIRVLPASGVVRVWRFRRTWEELK